MASFFGEIIEPSTRAIFDDFSDDEDASNNTELQLSWTNADKKVPSVFDVIFVIQGRLSLGKKKHNRVGMKKKKAFAEAYFIDANATPTAEIHVIENNSNIDRDADDHAIKTLPSRIYTDNNKAICLVSPSCSSELGYQFAETISPLLKASKKVIVITNDSLYNYKASSLNDLPAAFVRELKTSQNAGKDSAPKLPTPNFVIGIPAAVISWCQIFKKDGSAFVCYSDQQKLDSITASPYLSVINKLGYNIIKNERPNFERKSFYGKPEFIGGSSNIYI